jgi:CMP-N,N'-diacetyllegionaminic acid synthase
VSTDHPQIAAEAERLGVAVPFLRPENLSGDLVGDLPVLQHAVRTYEDLHKQKVDVILMLQPTCPLRTSKHVTDCIDLLLSSGTDSVWTVTQVSPKYHPLKQLVITGGKMRLSDADGSKIVARQQLEPSYIRNGVCYAWRRAPLMEISDFLPLNSQALVISEEIVNIDTAEDLERARSLLSREA